MECLESVGFVFNNVKTCIKRDKILKYQNVNCQECVYLCEQGSLNPCNCCFNNTQYNICIFKLRKENFITSSLGISTDRNNSWEVFKQNILFQKNANYVITVSKNGRLHSFYANMIKAKICNCCDNVLLYFKYNIISMLSCYDRFLNVQNNQNNQNNNEYMEICANLYSNITYKLKSDTYDTIRFYYSKNYTYKPLIC
jgi:hypothetical protein